jgi:Ni/Co efflux regulator RcnB
MIRAGIPHDQDPWGWSCGFYPGSHPGECSNGSAATFEQARSDFEEAWRAFLANRTEADFKEWRDQEAWTREKYRRFDRGERMPPDWRAGA